MTSNTPVETFRYTDPTVRRPTPYVRWTFYLLLLCLALLAGIGAGMIYLAWQGAFAPMSAGRESGISGEFRRDLAGKLQGAGLPEQAIEQYRLYLAEADLAPERRANMAFTIGKLCMDQGRYEDALTWLYQVEMFDPKTKLGPEVGSKIVACLEHLGRFAQAQYSLDSRSNLDRKGREEIRGEAVVAKIGDDSISLTELDEAMNALPPWMRDSVKGPEKKEAFLQQYVAEELIYRKAKKLELDKDEQVRKMADLTFRKLLVQKVLETEIQDKVKITPDDVDLYFQANKDRYAEKDGATPSLDAVRDRVQQDLYRERMEKVYRELIQQALQASDVKLFPEALGKGADEKKDVTQPKPQETEQGNARVAP